MQVDPEFAPDGGEVVRRIPGDLPRIAAVLRIIPAHAPAWDIAVGEAGWWRTPIPGAIAFISEWRAYLVDVVDHRILHEQPAARIREDEQHDLLLISDESRLTAIGSEGVAWVTDELAYDDLKVVAIEGRGIVCTGFAGGELPVEFVIDPLTGQRR